jgi:hypothetical protein
MQLLLWFEATGFSTWMRESGPAFFASLILHSVGMGFLVGVHAVLALVLLGVAPAVPPPLLRRFQPVGRLALWVVIASGFLLLAAYPTKALTNPLFYGKLLALAAALLVGARISRDWLGETSAARRPVGRDRVLAMLSLVLWVGTMTSGRLLAYTYHVLLAAHLH